MRILIVGSTGFIGKHLESTAIGRQMEVVTLSRRGYSLNGAMMGYPWALGHPVPQAACDGVQCAIHLAHDFEGAQGAHRTLEGTVAIIKQLNDAGVSRQLFFSSYSSGEHASSIYGRTKYAIEEAICKSTGVVIVRPGLVLGDGGLYGRIRQWAGILPFIPLPEGGRGAVPIITIEKLCDLSLSLAMSATVPHEANLFEVELKSLRQLVLEAAAERNRKPWILPIPTRWLTRLLRLSAILHIRLPVNSDNLAGFISNQSAAHRSTLHKV